MARYFTIYRICLLPLICLMLLSGSAYAQDDNIVYIPDQNFKAALIELGVDSNSDGDIQVGEAESYTNGTFYSLDVRGKGIEDLTGIKAFTSISGIIVSNNHLKELDLTSLDNINYLIANNNEITSIALGGLTRLLQVELNDNHIKSLDVSASDTYTLEINNNNISDLNLGNGSNLNLFEARNNNLTGSIDLSHFDRLELIALDNNQLTEVIVPQRQPVDELNTLSVSNNNLQRLVLKGIQSYEREDQANLELDATGNPDLKCIEVGDVAFAEENWREGVDPGVTFSLDCGYTSGTAVNIPDQNFKAALLADASINTNGDDEIQVSEAEAVTGTIKAVGEAISDLTGIEAFSNLEVLKVHYNSLSSVDLSANTALEELHIQSNQLTSLDVRNNPNLERLRVQDNNLTALDVSANSMLTYLEVTNNELTSLNVKNGNNANMTRFFASGNPGLGCVQVDDAAYAEANWSAHVDEGVEFSTDCGGDAEPIVTIPGENFKAALIEDGWDTNGDGEIQESEAAARDGMYVDGEGISDITGIDAFDLLYFNIAGNNLNELDLTSQTNLLEVDFSSNSLSNLTLPGGDLTVIYAQNNQFTSLDLSAYENLGTLHATNNQLTCIAVADPAYAEANWSDNVDEGVEFSTDCGGDAEPVVYIPDANFKQALIDLGVDTNGDGEIQVAEAEAYNAVTLDLRDKNIKDLTGVETFTSITTVNANDNLLTAFKLPDNVTGISANNNQIAAFEGLGLTYLELNNNNLSRLDISDSFIDYLEVNNNNLEELTLGRTTDLTHIEAKNNNLNGTLDLSSFERLELVALDNNQLTEVIVPQNQPIDELNTLSVSNNNLQQLDLSGQSYERDDQANLELNVTGNPNLECIEVGDVAFAEEYWREGVDPGITFSTDCGYSNGTVVNIPDENFKQALIELGVDTNGDGEIQVAEAEATTRRYLDVRNKSIKDITGIKAFTAVSVLLLSDNLIEEIDAGFPNNITDIFANNNNIRSINLEGLVYLGELYLNDNNIKSLDVSASDISILEINNNNVSDLNLGDGSNLYFFEATNNNLTGSIDLSQFDRLELIALDNNQLTEVIVPQNQPIDELNTLTVSNNNLQQLDLSGQSYERDDQANLELNATGNPNLECIEVGDVAFAEEYWREGVDPGVTFSTDCDATGPGDVVHIPDENFKAALLADESINTNGDDEIQVSEAEAFTGTIKAVGENISDLTGIEAFSNLEVLKVHYNSLSLVDLSANTALEELHIQSNQLTSLDVSNNPNIERLRVQDNNLTALDVSANSMLTYLEVTNNELTSLNVKNGNNANMTRFFASGNPGLSCVQVDDVTYAEANWSDNVDPGASFSEDCGSTAARLAEAEAPDVSERLVVTVFPNPTTDFMQVRSDQEFDALQLYSLSGDEMNVRFVNGEADIRHLRKGIYILKISAGEQMAAVRFMKR